MPTRVFFFSPELPFAAVELCVGKIIEITALSTLHVVFTIHCWTFSRISPAHASGSFWNLHTVSLFVSQLLFFECTLFAWLSRIVKFTIGHRYRGKNGYMYTSDHNGMKRSRYVARVNKKCIVVMLSLFDIWPKKALQWIKAHIFCSFLLSTIAGIFQFLLHSWSLEFSWKRSFSIICSAQRALAQLEFELLGWFSEWVNLSHPICAYLLRGLSDFFFEWDDSITLNENLWKKLRSKFTSEIYLRRLCKKS